MSPESYWQLQEMSQKVGVHYTTLNTWSRMLESKRIHYINRTIGNKQKVYDELDLKIFKYIKSKRENENWNLEAIMDTLPELFPDLRPFPDDYQDNDNDLTIDTLRHEMTNMVHNILDTYNKSIQQEIAAQVQNLRNMLPPQRDPEEERAERMNMMMTEYRIKHTLEKEAEKEWEKLPESQRMRKIGLFRKEEDLIKKERFIRQYVYDNFERKLKEVFGLNNL